ncbi:hypothetical protein JTB14_035662 [Gonioctena quinquepunctata]|nr:hypothetical protein JTB14_035662 [Gonioctena quinquepunctata]
MTHGGYIARPKTFGESYPIISYFQSYDPTYHTIRNQHAVNFALYTIFGDYSASTQYIKKKTKFMKNYLASHNDRLQRLAGHLNLRLDVVVNFDFYEVEPVFLTPKTNKNEDDDDLTRQR